MTSPRAAEYFCSSYSQKIDYNFKFVKETAMNSYLIMKECQTLLFFSIFLSGAFKYFFLFVYIYIYIYILANISYCVFLKWSLEISVFIYAYR